VRLASTAEVAAIAGVAKQSVSRLKREGRLPAPIATLRCGPIWDRNQVEAWARERRERRSARKRGPAAVSVPAPPAAELASTGSGFEAALAELERMRAASR
jgi:hypothetical protein